MDKKGWKEVCSDQWKISSFELVILGIAFVVEMAILLTKVRCI